MANHNQLGPFLFSLDGPWGTLSSENTSIISQITYLRRQTSVTCASAPVQRPQSVAEGKLIYETWYNVGTIGDLEKARASKAAKVSVQRGVVTPVIVMNIAGHMPWVRELDLNCTKVTLPLLLDVTEKLHNLEKLWLSSNGLKKLPAEMFAHIGQLKELYLGSNELTELPPEIARLKQLTKLVLRDNQLASLPMETIGYLTCLRSLVIVRTPVAKNDALIEQLQRRLPNCDLTY